MRQTTSTVIRITDPLVLKKLSLLASCHNRSRNGEIEWALAQYIRAYEKMYGELFTPDGKVCETATEAIKTQDGDLYECIGELAREDFEMELSSEADIYDSLETSK